MPGKEILNGASSSANGTSETFLFTSESVGEGHPGNKQFITLIIDPLKNWSP